MSDDAGEAVYKHVHATRTPEGVESKRENDEDASAAAQRWASEAPAIWTRGDRQRVVDREPLPPQFRHEGGKTVLDVRPGWELHRDPDDGSVSFFDPTAGTVEVCTLPVLADGSNVVVINHGPPVGGWLVKS